MPNRPHPGGGLSPGDRNVTDRSSFGGKPMRGGNGGGGDDLLGGRSSIPGMAAPNRSALVVADALAAQSIATTAPINYDSVSSDTLMMVQTGANWYAELKASGPWDLRCTVRIDRTWGSGEYCAMDYYLDNQYFKRLALAEPTSGTKLFLSGASRDWLTTGQRISIRLTHNIGSPVALMVSAGNCWLTLTHEQ